MNPIELLIPGNAVKFIGYQKIYILVKLTVKNELVAIPNFGNYPNDYTILLKLKDYNDALINKVDPHLSISKIYKTHYSYTSRGVYRNDYALWSAPEIVNIPKVVLDNIPKEIKELYHLNNY